MTLMNLALLVIAVAGLVSIRRDRRAHDRELLRKRTRTFQGDLS